METAAIIEHKPADDKDHYKIITKGGAQVDYIDKTNDKLLIHRSLYNGSFLQTEIYISVT